MSKLLAQSASGSAINFLGMIPPRVLECFGVAGLLSDDCEVFYTSLFSTQHLGQVSDLIIAKLKDKGVDELRLRASLLFGMFDVYHAQQSLQYGGRLPEPLVVECGFDKEKIAIGLAFQVPDVLSLELTGMSKKILSAEEESELETDFELLLKYLSMHSHRLMIRFQPSTNRLEIVSMLLLNSEKNSSDTIKYLESEENLKQIQIIFLQDTKLVTPKAKKYVELGDTDYSKALAEDSPFTRTPRSPTGEIISKAIEIAPDELERLLTNGPSVNDIQKIKGGDKDGLFETLVKGAASAMQDQVIKIAAGTPGGMGSDMLIKIAGAQAGESHSEIGKFLNMPFSSEKEGMYVGKIKELEEKIREYEEAELEDEEESEEEDEENSITVKSKRSNKDDEDFDEDDFSEEDDSVADKKKKRRKNKKNKSIGEVIGSIWPFSKKVEEEDEDEEDSEIADDDVEITEIEETEENQEKLLEKSKITKKVENKKNNPEAPELDEGENDFNEENISDLIDADSKIERKITKKKALVDEEYSISEEAEKELSQLNEEATRINPKLKELTEQEEKTSEESKKLMDTLEESSGKMSHAIDSASKTAEELKEELGDNSKAKRLVEGMMGELVAERSKLNEATKKLNLTLRQKDMELKNKESAFQEELRKKTELLKQRNSAVTRTKEQLAQVQSQIEKLKTTSMKSNSEDAQNKQKLQQTSKLLENARDENLKLLNKVEELRAQVKQATFERAKAKGSTGDDHQSAAKLDRANRQIDEFKKINQQLMERLNETRKEQVDEANRLRIEVERLKQELKVSISASGVSSKKEGNEAA